jgi:ankyrin repeat protein
MVMLLHQYKSDLNILNFNGASSLIFVATFGHSDIIKYLLAQKADKSIKDKWGETALDYAVNQKNDEVIALLK